MQPMLKTFRRHRLMPTLVVLQIALAMAILCNALSLLQQRLAPLFVHDGVAANQVILISHIYNTTGKGWSGAQIQTGYAELRAIPGVIAVSAGSPLPMVSGWYDSDSIFSSNGKHKADAAIYVGNNLVNALGLKLVAGRNFSPSERVDATMQNEGGLNTDAPVILTHAIAQRLFPDTNPLGQQVRVGSKHPSYHTVVGVVGHLLRNDFNSANQSAAGNVLLIPGRFIDYPAIEYAVRTDPNVLPAVLKSVPVALRRAFPPNDATAHSRPRIETFEAARAAFFHGRRAAVWLLSSVTLVVLIVTLIGIMGLTGFWVQQRTRQIGVRRALGARRIDILRYFQTENLLLATAGIALGCAAAIGINVWLMAHYAVPRLPIIYLPIGALTLWALGQLAVLGPALRAARVPPTTAMRAA